MTGTGDTAHWLRALALLPENPDSIPGAHMADCNL